MKRLVRLSFVAVVLCLLSSLVACRLGSDFDGSTPAGTPAPVNQGFTLQEMQQLVQVARSQQAALPLPVQVPAATFYRFDFRNERGGNRLSTIVNYAEATASPAYGLETTARALLFDAKRTALGYDFDYFAFAPTIATAAIDRVVAAMSSQFADVEFLLRSPVHIGSVPAVIAVVEAEAAALANPASGTFMPSALASGPIDIDLVPRFSALDSTTLMKLIGTSSVTIFWKVA